MDPPGVISPLERTSSAAEKSFVNSGKLTKLHEQIALDLPIAAIDLVKAGYVSRTKLWRLQRGGMPLTRVGRRIFVRFSDLVAAGGS